MTQKHSYEEMEQRIKVLEEEAIKGKRTEEALRESEDKYRILVENANDIIYRTDALGRITFCNLIALKYFGYAVEDLIGKHYTEFIRPDCRIELERFYGLQFVKKIPITYYEFPLLTRDKADVWLGQNVQLIIDDGQVVGFHAIARDITDRKRAEEALHQSEEKYRTIIEDIQEGYFELDLTGNYTFANDAECRNIGYSREELIGMNNRQYQDETTVQKMNQRFKRLYETGEPIKVFDIEIIRKNGTKAFNEISASLIRDAEGKPIGFRGISRDITDRKQVEEQLHQTLDRLKKAVGTTIQVLGTASEARDPYTSGHQKKVADLARTIATEMGLPHDTIEGIRMAGSIHDIGKLSIPAEILSKPTKLTEIEFSLIKEHSRSGYEMLKDVESPWPLAQIVYQHHERMDGSGYPRNLKGVEIIIEARIMAVADVVEAMASHRPYRPGLGIDAAMAEIEKNKGTHYDNTVADACLRLFREKGYKFK